MTKLVIGIGNPDRGDDAAGILAVRRLRSMKVIERADCSDLIDLWDGAEDVIVIDAMRSGRTPGTVMRFDAIAESLPTRTFPSTHNFGIAETVELARVLGRLPERMRIYGIEAGDFTHGTGPSPEVVAAAASVADEIGRGS